MKYRLFFLICFFIVLAARAEENVGAEIQEDKTIKQGFLCDQLSGFSSEKQKQVAVGQCTALQELFEYESAACNLDVSKHMNVASEQIVSMKYNIHYQCPNDVLQQEQSYTYSWLKDGRLVPVKSVWFSLLSDERDEVLKEVVKDQDADARCPKPYQPTKIEITEGAVIFSGFYPEITNEIQQAACDIGILRPPFFLDSFMETDGTASCQIPQDLSIRAAQLLVLMEAFKQDLSDKQLAAKVWAVFPKNYRELTFMEGYWWQPGWEKMAAGRRFIQWQELSDSEADSFDACSGPLYYHGEKDIPKIWYALYQHIDKTEWILTNLRFQSGLWQADSLNYLADFYPAELHDVWDETAEGKAWEKITVSELSGIIAWHNSMASHKEKCKEDSQCDIINPIDVDKLPLAPDEKLRLKRKIQAAIAQYLR